MHCNRRRFLQSMAVTGAGLCLPSLTWAGFDPLWKPGSVCANPIDVTVFEMFKIGPGPSSSHTIAPMSAGNDFLHLCAQLPQEQLAQADAVKVHLYGSLSGTALTAQWRRVCLGKSPMNARPNFWTTFL